MKKYGLRNSLLTAIMPTASSAHILGNGEAAEPFTDLIYSRTVLSGQFMIVNKHMVKDLEDIGMWTTETIQNIVLNRGSMTNLSLDKDSKYYDRLEFLKLKYKTVYEIPQKVIVDLAADRAEFIDQTQSQNCHMERPTKEKLNAYHFYCWQKRLKTGMYYCRQKALTDAINISVNNIVIPTSRNRKIVCTDEICTSCTA
jgi:ribonucleoside-diphosphate reductase subunit M1